MKKSFIIVLLIACVCAVSCSKDSAADQEVPDGDTAAAVQEVTQSVAVAQTDDAGNVQPASESAASAATKKAPVGQKTVTPETVKSVLNVSFSSDALSTAAYHTDAHQQYLDDELIFKPLDDGGVTGDVSYLVKGYGCKFYPADSFTEVATSDGKRYLLKEDAQGIDVSIGTLLTVASSLPNKKYWYGGFLPEHILCGGDEWYEQQYGYFFMDNAYNYFFKTEYEGQEGYVFGAYIQAQNAMQNKVDSLLYKTNACFPEFYPYIGYSTLDPEIQEALEEDHLVIKKLNSDKWLYTDDLVDQYSTYAQNSLFVTTELASHVQHRIFDNQLQKIEEQFFIPRLQDISGKFIEKLSERDDLPEDIKHCAIAYFQVPEAILRTTPTVYLDDGGREHYYDNLDKRPEINYGEVDVDAILSDYTEDVRSDYEQVMTAAGEYTAIFGTREDFTQYKPRGHYTKNKALESYFKAQMWFGRIHFCIAESGKDPVADEETAKMEPIAMAIVDTVLKNPELYDEWKSLFDPITELIGLSDDLSIAEVMPLWEDQGVSDFTAWVSDKNNLNAFINLCHDKLRPPAIFGNSAVTGPVEYGENNEKKPPMGWRFLGQCFTYDSDVHQTACQPSTRTRSLVRGLDIMKAFGSKTADALLSLEDYQDSMIGQSSFAGGTDLKVNLNKKMEEFASYDSSFWTQTYYNSVLAQIKAQATFEQGAGFYFTESPKWNIKAMIGAHATWAELRHDTILYVKQVYNAAERSGDGELEPTFLYEPVPKPINYIEPNLPFWEYSLASIVSLNNILSDYDLLDVETQTLFSGLADLYENAVRIVKLEAADQPISEQDNYWIRTVPSQLGSLLTLKNYSAAMAYVDEDSKKMACIADVYTEPEGGVCLEVGVGTPYRIYVPLNDGQGGKRIAIGYIPSYYEFYHDMTDRMTDEQWKAIVYQEGVDMTEYEPFWEQGCYLKPN